MPFQFRFKVLMQHREFLLKQAQIGVAAARQHHAEIEVHMERVRNEAMDQSRMLEERQAAGINAADYLSYNEYIRHLEQRLLYMEGELDKAAQEVESARAVLIEREKDLKMMESLEENDRQSYRYHQTKVEQRLTDEIATIGDFRKKGRD